MKETRADSFLDRVQKFLYFSDSDGVISEPFQVENMPWAIEDLVKRI
jgi:hypothetical protein